MSSLILYYTVLLLLSTCVHLTDSLTITSVTQSDGSAGALPAQISLPSGRSGYNLQAGDTVIIKCDDSITRPKILTPSHPFAQVCIHKFGRQIPDFSQFLQGYANASGYTKIYYLGLVTSIRPRPTALLFSGQLTFTKLLAKFSRHGRQKENCGLFPSIFLRNSKLKYRSIARIG